MICDESYGHVPFALGIADYRHHLSPAFINDESHIAISGECLNISSGGRSLSIVLKTKEYEGLTGGKMPLGAFKKTALAKLQASGKGSFRRLVDEKAAETPYSKIIIKKQDGDRLDLSACLDELIGLGPGLTPSGDDLLCGYVYDRLRFGKNGDLDRLMSGIRELMPVMTNRISCLYLSHVMDGRPFSLFDDVCFAKDEEGLSKAVDSLLLMGSNSGADVLCGILLARYQD